MKKHVIIIISFVCLLIVSFLTYTIFFNNNVYGNDETIEIEIQEIKNSIAQLQDTQVNIDRYTEDQQKITLLETKISELDTSLISMQNKMNEQLQTINTLKNRIAVLEQNNKNKLIGTWKEIRNLESGQQMIIIFEFKEDGTVIKKITNKDNVTSTSEYVYRNNIMTLSNNFEVGSITFFTLINDNTMQVYYGNISANGVYYKYNLIKQ